MWFRARNSYSRFSRIACKCKNAEPENASSSACCDQSHLIQGPKPDYKVRGDDPDDPLDGPELESWLEPLEDPDEPLGSDAEPELDPEELLDGSVGEPELDPEELLLEDSVAEPLESELLPEPRPEGELPAPMDEA